MDEPMDCEHPTLHVEVPAPSHSVAAEPSASPALSDKLRFRIAAVLAFANHSGNAHDAGEALMLDKEFSGAAKAKNRNLLQFIRDWYGNFIVRGHIFDEER
jgi:hypothetical protein